MYLVYSLLVGAWYSTREVFFFYPQEKSFFLFYFFVSKSTREDLLYVVSCAILNSGSHFPVCVFSPSLSQKIKKKKVKKSRKYVFFSLILPYSTAISIFYLYKSFFPLLYFTLYFINYNFLNIF